MAPSRSTAANAGPRGRRDRASRGSSGRPVRLPPAFHPVERLRFNRLTLTRYMAKRPHPVPYHVLRDIPTGFGRNAVVIDGEPSQAYVPGGWR